MGWGREGPRTWRPAASRRDRTWSMELQLREVDKWHPTHRCNLAALLVTNGHLRKHQTTLQALYRHGLFEGGVNCPHFLDEKTEAREVAPCCPHLATPLGSDPRLFPHTTHE